jgi:hypothetical protein
LWLFQRGCVTLGKRYVDKLVQVHRHTGQEDWIYIHIEVQGGLRQAAHHQPVFCD